jgi:hypothetical protein
LEDHDWSAAVLDYALCDGDCSPLCDWFVARTIPFVVCTGHEDIGGSCRSGTHIMKPADSAVLVTTLEQLIRPAEARV